MIEAEAVTEQEALDLASLHDILEEYKCEKGAVIPVLQKAQDIYGWLPAEVMETIARGMSVPLSQNLWGGDVLFSVLSRSSRASHYSTVARRALLGDNLVNRDVGKAKGGLCPVFSQPVNGVMSGPALRDPVSPTDQGEAGDSKGRQTRS